ncbi:unnamed protein product [Eruca vesicaria subsp. sativa]|uniref:Cysteine protease inhibitor WSCP-like n=1 Tax=Eruca vesicaria subsp. sativa TaxID=29727 RepID=A0ABC8KTL6_ERUVS|nr:unnamed protein product [Eruca vesicaria subsp. sativa]
MKTSFLVILLLAAAVCTHGQRPRAEEVKDSKGNPVLIGEKYFIQPVKSNGGGLVPAPANIFPLCPLGITQTLLPFQPGLPVSFQYYTISVIHSPLYVSLSTVIKFESDFWPVCKDFSKVWGVDVSSSAGREPNIIIGGKDTALESAFKVEKATGENTYKLTINVYGTVGTIPGAWGGAPQLVATNDEAKTLFVKFVKVDATKATTSTSRVEKLGLRMFPFY